MTVLPFVCLGLGIVVGRFCTKKRIIDLSEKVSTIALILLMLAIGVGIGIDENIIKQFHIIGLNCVVIALCAIGMSVLFVTIFEKTILPLERYKREVQQSDATSITGNEGISSLVWIMPLSIIAGLGLGALFREYISSAIIDGSFTVALIVLYLCVGIGQGSNRNVIPYLKKIGFKVLLIPVAIIIGSISGGFIASLICSVPAKVSVISASGMSFYSLTGAFMTQTYGLAVGTYGFIVNVLREFITVITMPVLIKIGNGAPIAGGAAGDMDTMLAPVTKFVGEELGLVTLLTGTVLTFVVPFSLPLLSWMF